MFRTSRSLISRECFLWLGQNDARDVVEYTKQMTSDHLKLDSAVFCIVVSGKSDSAQNDVVLGMLDASGHNKIAVMSRERTCLVSVEDTLLSRIVALLQIK